MQEVEKFLLLNPDIQEEFELFNATLISETAETFVDKASLKKIPFHNTSVSSEYFQRLCVAHIEGVLPDEENAFLQKIVKGDPEKMKELQLFKRTKLFVSNELFNEKLLLKQGEIIHEITDYNFEEYCIACLEGWLDQVGLVSLNNFIVEHPEKKRVFDLYNKTMLIPDLSIVYPDKRKIKRFNLLSINAKKHISVISSAAAILVFGVMIYYVNTLDDKTKLSSHFTSESYMEKNQINEVNGTVEPVSLTEKIKQKKRSVLHDPFGFEKISSIQNEPAFISNSNNRLNIDPIQPIRITKIDCLPCNKMLEEKQLSVLAPEILTSTDTLENKNIETGINEFPKYSGNKNTMWELAQAGINGFNKISNAELKVEKSEKENKTKIAFNSKYFSFSTQLNNKN
jgi:hypothetical protein